MASVPVPVKVIDVVDATHFTAAAAVVSEQTTIGAVVYVPVRACVAAPATSVTLPARSVLLAVPVAIVGAVKRTSVESPVCVWVICEQPVSPGIVQIVVVDDPGSRVYDPSCDALTICPLTPFPATAFTANEAEVAPLPAVKTVLSGQVLNRPLKKVVVMQEVSACQMR